MRNFAFIKNSILKYVAFCIQKKHDVNVDMLLFEVQGKKVIFFIMFVGPSEALVDPFLEMDPEQLERLETALQSEQAKQILGENVTAMLGMYHFTHLVFVVNSCINTY